MIKITQLCFIAILSFFLGCENGFKSLEENNRYVFSINGTLDVHADSQWIRVMPIGESIIPSNQNPTGTEVSILHVNSGQRSLLNDSLYQFNDAYVWNYWSPDTILANEEYRINAIDTDGKQSSVTVNTPSALPLPDFEYSQDFETISVSGTTEDSLVLLETIYHVQPLVAVGCGPEREIRFSHLEDLRMYPDGTYSFNSTNREAIAMELGVGPFSFIVNQRKLVIISAGETWPNYTNISETEATYPDVISNVENGTGFVGGIAKREIKLTPPQPPCEN